MQKSKDSEGDASSEDDTNGNKEQAEDAKQMKMQLNNQQVLLHVSLPITRMIKLR